MLPIHVNHAGTMFASWSIGKGGPTIWQGAALPADSAGNDGDLFILTGAAPRLYMRQINGWLPSADPSFGFIPESVTAHGHTLDLKTNYAGVNFSTAGIVNLSEVAFVGKQVTIKDESGTAGTNVITVQPPAGSGLLIDGEPSWAIDINYGVLELVFGTSGMWHLRSAITSSPFNQMRS